MVLRETTPSWSRTVRFRETFTWDGPLLLTERGIDPEDGWTLSAVHRWDDLGRPVALDEYHDDRFWIRGTRTTWTCPW